MNLLLIKMFLSLVPAVLLFCLQQNAIHLFLLNQTFFTQEKFQDFCKALEILELFGQISGLPNNLVIQFSMSVCYSDISGGSIAFCHGNMGT